MPVLWIASGNEKKRAELSRLLGSLPFELHLQREAEGFEPVPEDQPDFAGNAERKATALARFVAAPALGDDSGLCVDALGGRPGVHSARYAGDEATDRDRIDKLLGELSGVPAPERSAHFACHVCLAAADGRVLARIEEVCEGAIIEEPRGDGGFGYDPVFVAAEHRGSENAPTFAQLSASEKDAVSHRGKALRRLVEFLREHPL
jgi:XTP/dITP diphosphohydrolase